MERGRRRDARARSEKGADERVPGSAAAEQGETRVERGRALAGGERLTGVGGSERGAEQEGRRAAMLMVGDGRSKGRGRGSGSGRRDRGGRLG